MKRTYFLCGAVGCCLEVLWTGLHSLLQKDYKLKGQSSLWMFPIYGLAAFILPISKKLDGKSLFVRGSIYTCGIFATELSTGTILKKFKLCPWDYSHAVSNYKGLIRLDYAPVWFITGLFYEKILRKNTSTNS